MLIILCDSYYMSHTNKSIEIDKIFRLNMDDANRILTQIQTVKEKIEYHEVELSQLKIQYEAAMRKKISEVLETKTEPKSTDPKVNEKIASSLTPSRIDRKNSTSSSSDGASRKNRKLFDPDNPTRNEGPKPKQKRNTDTHEDLIRMLIVLRGRHLTAIDRTRIVRVQRETLQDNSNSPYRMLERHDVTMNNIDFIFDLFRANTREAVHNSLSFLSFSDDKNAHYLRAKIEFLFLNDYDRNWFIALAQIRDIEVVRGQGGIIDNYYSFGRSELFTIVNIQKSRTRGYQGYPKEKIEYSAIIESDHYLIRKFNRKELSGPAMTLIKRFTIYDETKRVANSKVKAPQSTSQNQPTTGWGNTPQPTTGWGCSTPHAWGSPQRSENDSWSQFPGPLLTVPNYQMQMPQGQMSQGPSQTAQYLNAPGTSGLNPQSSNMIPYGPLLCPPFGPQSPSGPPGPSGPQGPQGQSNFQGPVNPGLVQPYQTQPNLYHQNNPDNQKPIELNEDPLDLSKEKIDLLKKDLEKTADEIVAPKDAQENSTQEQSAQVKATSDPSTEKLETVTLLLISKPDQQEDNEKKEKEGQETVPKKKTAGTELSPKPSSELEEEPSELEEEELLQS